MVTYRLIDKTRGIDFRAYARPWNRLVITLSKTNPG